MLICFNYSFTLKDFDPMNTSVLLLVSFNDNRDMHMAYGEYGIINYICMYMSFFFYSIYFY